MYHFLEAMGVIALILISLICIMLTAVFSQHETRIKALEAIVLHHTEKGE